MVGKPKPEPGEKKKAVFVRMTPAEKQMLIDIGKREHRNMSEQVLHWIYKEHRAR